MSRGGDSGRAFAAGSDLGRAFAAGGAPSAWREAMRRTVEATATVEQCGTAVEALGAETISVSREPTFGRLIDEILDRPAPAPRIPDPEPVSGRPRPRPPSNPPRENRQDPKAGPSRTGGGDRGAFDPGREPPAGCAATASATASEVLALSPRIPERALQQRLATSPSAAPATDGATVAQASTVRKATDLDERRRRSPDRRTDLPFKRPTTSPARDRSRSAGPEPAGWVPLDRVASRIGARSGEDLRRSLRSVPRPGPGVPETMLDRLRTGDQVDPWDRSSDDGNTRAPSTGEGPTRERPARRRAEPTGHEGRAEAKDRAKAEDRAKAKDRAEADVRQPGPAAPESAHVAEPADFDVPEIRRVTTHHEMPPVPRRRRSSEPATGDGSREETTRPDASHAGSPTEYRASDDLEQRMKQILDEAARRHGIEV